MSLCARLRNFLDENQIPYLTITHSPAYTAHGLAASVHVKGQSLVKPVMVRGDGRHYMVATSANHRIDLEKLRQALGVRELRLEREEDFTALFEDCEAGAMPPFGNLYGIPVIADGTLWEDEEIAFNGGDHRTVVKMSFHDFERLVHPARADVVMTH